MKRSVLCASLLAGAFIPPLASPALAQSGFLAGPAPTATEVATAKVQAGITASRKNPGNDC